MKQSFAEAKIVSEYWLDESTYLVCTDEFRLGPDWNSDLHGVAWGEMWVDDEYSKHWGINIYEDEGGYVDTLYPDDEMFIQFPDELKHKMLRSLEFVELSMRHS